MMLGPHGDLFEGVNMRGWIAHPSQILTDACDDGINKAYIETHVVNLVEGNAMTDNSISSNKYRMMWAGVEY